MNTMNTMNTKRDLYECMHAFLAGVAAAKGNP